VYSRHVPEDPRPPVAIRITRPYASEDEFLEHELETLSRTSVTLLGAQPRPQGVVLRFELMLSSGQVLMRGEGRVVGFRPNAYQGLGGLTLRFTRLDSRSKSLVDRAAAVRERRRPSLGGPPMSERSVRGESVDSLPSSEQLGDGPPSSRTSFSGDLAVPLEVRSEPTLPGSQPPPPSRAPPPVTHPPPGREELLDRLRTRGKALEPSAVQRILQPSKRRA
jgi:hypothetical protein